MIYGDGTVKGQRLANPKDPVVRSALTRTCPDCDSKPDEWCVATNPGTKRLGKRRGRLHFSRCSFDPAQ